METINIIFLIVMSFHGPQNQPSKVDCDQLNIPMYMVENSVLRSLNNPSTAKFQSQDMEIIRKGQSFPGDTNCLFTIVEHVIVQNKSGEKIKQEFISSITYSYKFNQWEVIFTDVRFKEDILTKIIGIILGFITGGFAFYILFNFKAWLYNPSKI